MAIDGNRIRSLRKNAGLTQEALGKKLGVIKQTVSNWENNVSEPNSEILLNIASIFNVQVSSLISRTDTSHFDSDLEWKYSDVSNRLGNILKKYRQQKNLSEQLFSEKLDITIETYIGIEIGEYTPSLKLLQKISEETNYDIDYLTGSTNHTSIPTDKVYSINGHNFSINDFESDYYFRSRFEELCRDKGINSSNVEITLGLTKQEYIDVSCNRMPTLSELLKISYALGVSLDYLIGKNDIKLSSLSADELNLILNYRECLPCYKENICQRAKELSIESISERNGLSVAEDETLKKTGTENMGK